MSDYVYIFRAERGRALYVGYGASPERAISHLKESHNPKLNELVQKKGEIHIEIAGPFNTEEIGRLVETSVMSALGFGSELFNVAQGPSHARFRPIGVPVDFAERPSMEKLQLDDFISVQKDSPMPVLFVRVNDKNFDDGRVGYDLANPPTDVQTRERVDRWWQLSGYVKKWSETPNESPGLLIGITGKPGAQLVIASLMIDRTAWGKVGAYPRGEGKISIPLTTPTNLDAFNLRGRRVDRTTGLAFNSFASGCYIILNLDRTLSGGRRPRK